MISRAHAHLRLAARQSCLVRHTRIHRQSAYEFCLLCTTSMSYAVYVHTTRPCCSTLVAPIVTHCAQGLALALMAAWGWLDDAQEAFRIRSFLLCVEMLPAAGLLIFAFPWSIYSIAGWIMMGCRLLSHGYHLRCSQAKPLASSVPPCCTP